MATHRATVTEIEELAPSVMQLTIAFTDTPLRFKPGQWVNFKFPEGMSRAYTIASAPERPEALQLCVRLGAGKGGAALTKLAAGASVSIEGPHGDFVLPEKSDKPVVLLAGDTGIAPIRSIVLHMLAVKDPRTITVLYEPDQRHILYAGDFDPLARSGAITHESGKIETLIARNARLIEGTTKMAAGFDPFLDRVRVSLSVNALGDDLIAESFGPVP